MSLRRKISLIILVAVAGYAALDYGIQRWVVMSKFLSLEREEARKDMQRCTGAIQRETQHLDTLCVDWAVWNDTYQFIQDRNDKYTESNLNDETFKSNGLSLLLLYDTQRQLVWGQLNGPENRHYEGTEQVRQLFAAPLEDLLEHNDPESCIKGVARTAVGPMLISSRPIITSEHKGPIRGTLIMGRLLDDELIRKISEQACVPMQLWPIPEDSLSPQQRQMAEGITPAQPTRLVPRDSRTMDVYAVVEGIHRTGALLVKAQVPRDISLKGAQASRIALASIVASGGVLLLLVLGALQRSIMRPLAALTGIVSRAGASGEPTACPAALRKDEIGVLAWQFTRSFEELQRRERLLSGVAEAGASLLRLSDEKRGFRQVLKVLGTAAGADRAYVFQHHLDEQTGKRLVSQRHEWAREGISPEVDNPALQNMDCDQWPGLYSTLSGGNVVRGWLEDFPESVQALLRAQRIQSILLVPIMIDGEFWGFIGFDACHPDGAHEVETPAPVSGRRWTATEEALLVAAASNIGSALMRKRSQDALEKARRLAERANASKSEFLARMSHEIRTPMNGVIGMTHLLTNTPLTGQQQGYARIIKLSAESLLALINDILDFSKIEAGKLELHPAEFNLPALVEDVADMFSQKAAQKGLELAAVAAPGVPTMVVGDADCLRQVLVNLVGNAIKFTERGEVIVRVTPEKVGPEQTLIRFEIRDTGPGISEEQLGRLFKSFSQVDSSATRRHGGTGLGLAISKRLAELMGGAVGVRSKVGEGSTFHFTACFGQGREPARRSEVVLSELRNLRVLCVDDSPANRQVLGEQLTSWGFASEAAGDASQAVEMLRSATAEGRPFGMVILDSHLPGKSGVELSRAIKDDLAIGQNVRVIMAQVDAPIDSSELASAGISHCLTKPVRQSRLFDAIARAVAGSAGPADQAEVAPPEKLQAKAKGALILLAEDNEVNQVLAAEVLRVAGFQYDIAVNGLEAVEALVRKKYDLVLMDCQMPEMDGLEATCSIRAKEAIGMVFSRHGGHIPIIALTANAVAGERQRCLEAGMDEYVPKPIVPSELVKAIDAQLQPPEAHAPELSPPPGAVAAEASTGDRPPAGAGPPSLDYGDLLQRCLGKEELVRKLLETFQQSWPGDLEALSGAVASRRAPEAARLAHSLKGAAANLSAPALRQAAAELEQLCRAEQWAAAAGALPGLEEQLERCREYIQGLAAVPSPT